MSECTHGNDLCTHKIDAAIKAIEEFDYGEHYKYQACQEYNLKKWYYSRCGFPEVSKYGCPVHGINGCYEEYFNEVAKLWGKG